MSEKVHLRMSSFSELYEGQSNQAETSTASRHGTMIVQAEALPNAAKGKQVEYLAGGRGNLLFAFVKLCKSHL